MPASWCWPPAGGHRRLVDARLRVGPAGRFARAYCETHRLRAPRGKVVAVLGAGASAMDNAAVALEHGAPRCTCSAAAPASAGAALSLADVRRTSCGTWRDPGRCLALAVHGHDPAGCGKASLPTLMTVARLSPTSSAHRPPWPSAQPSDGRVRIETRARAVPRRLRDLRHGHRHGLLACAPSCLGSRQHRPVVPIATRRRRAA